MFHHPSHYILGDMIPPNQGSNLSLDLSLHMTPREYCYISGYKGPNEISQDVPYRGRDLIFVVKFSDPEGETITRGNLYKFVMMTSPEISHIGKTIISPNW